MSRAPVASVWISEASPRQYSHEVLVKKIFGTRWRAARRSRRPSRRPVTGSVPAVSVNGNGSLGSDADGCPKRMLKSPPRLAAGDVHQQAVEHQPLRLVLVEAEIEELAQKTAALRRAEGVGLPDVAGAGVACRAAVPQEGHDIARRQQAQPDHRRAGCRVDHLIDPAGFEAGGEIDVVRVGDDTPRLQPGE